MDWGQLRAVAFEIVRVGIALVGDRRRETSPDQTEQVNHLLAITDKCRNDREDLVRQAGATKGVQTALDFCQTQTGVAVWGPLCILCLLIGFLAGVLCTSLLWVRLRNFDSTAHRVPASTQVPKLGSHTQSSQEHGAAEPTEAVVAARLRARALRG